MLSNNRYNVLTQENKINESKLNNFKQNKSKPIIIKKTNNNNNNNNNNKHWANIAKKMPNYIDKNCVSNELKTRMNTTLYKNNNYIHNNNHNNNNNYEYNDSDNEEENKNWHKQYYNELGLDSSFDDDNDPYDDNGYCRN